MPSEEGPVTIGRYRLSSPIAAGGMASVCLALQGGSAGFSRLVAIKRMLPQFADEARFVDMFLDEARLAARVRHPNVVETYDVVREREEVVIVLEYVEGDSLSAISKQARSMGERLPLDIAATILASACRGLHAAHEARGPDGKHLGIVHRDVSPHNILVGVDGVTRVADFGIARATGRLTQTAVGEIKGKPAYMAPEQLRRGEATRRSDIYAAGVVLWELCAGRRAFEAPSQQELIFLVMTEPIPALSAVAPWVDPALAAIVHRALAIDPDERFPTAMDLAEAISDVVPRASEDRIGRLVECYCERQLERRRRIARALERAVTDTGEVAEPTHVRESPPDATVTLPRPDFESPETMSDHRSSRTSSSSEEAQLPSRSSLETMTMDAVPGSSAPDEPPISSLETLTMAAVPPDVGSNGVVLVTPPNDAFAAESTTTRAGFDSTGGPAMAAESVDRSDVRAGTSRAAPSRDAWKPIALVAAALLLLASLAVFARVDGTSVRSEPSSPRPRLPMSSERLDSPVPVPSATSPATVDVAPSAVGSAMPAAAVSIDVPADERPPAHDAPQRPEVPSDEGTIELDEPSFEVVTPPPSADGFETTPPPIGSTRAAVPSSAIVPTRPPAPLPPTAESCDPPTYVGEDGIRRIKRHCF
jgi:serine/threonine protein kinase